MGKRIFTKDRIGATINSLKILDWKRENKKTYFYVHCLLCGAEKWMRADGITSGRSISCGCYNKNNNLKKNSDLTGGKFGRLTPIRATDKRDKNNGAVTWECKCDCGRRALVSAHNLIRGGVTSCGCLAREYHAKHGNEIGAMIKDKYCIDNTNINNIKSKKLYSNNTSGIRGVSWDRQRNKWLAQIRFKNKNYNLGRYPDKKAAIAARKLAEGKLFGEFLEWYEKHKSEEN